MSGEISHDETPQIDEEKIKATTLLGMPFTITTYTLPRETESYVEEVLTTLLKLVEQEKLRDYLVYCVQELAVNAKKANTKRVYFTERGLDIDNLEDYKLGMETFKDDTLSNIAHYLNLQKEKGLYVKLVFQIIKQILQIEVRNNSALTKPELTRIHNKLSLSRQYTSFEEAFLSIIDESEGAGLGIVVVVLMLKKIGLDKDCIDIMGTDKETIIRINIPLDKVQFPEELPQLDSP